ncbi:hypothetical protein PGTUg99_010230 [Puccinia graminis f. sp. tritici]|uniref:OTU domain-containing protein 1 n=1 Tax=Puccinia graminis f. sp. tritici TaxID=56615 RepID=A0A5B0SHM4_PUCGR|nr:hypothetical protein PGTUg99_010230 [Puccinia graminis f. sp. tritici]
MTGQKPRNHISHLITVTSYYPSFLKTLSLACFTLFILRVEGMFTARPSMITTEFAKPQPIARVSDNFLHADNSVETIGIPVRDDKQNMIRYPHLPGEAGIHLDRVDKLPPIEYPVKPVPKPLADPEVGSPNLPQKTKQKWTWRRFKDHIKTKFKALIAKLKKLFTWRKKITPLDGKLQKPTSVRPPGPKANEAAQGQPTEVNALVQGPPIKANAAVQAQPIMTNEVAPATHGPALYPSQDDGYLDHSFSSSSSSDSSYPGSSRWGSFSGTSGSWSPPRQPVAPRLSGSDDALHRLNNLKLITKLPESTTLVPIEHLPGYAKTQGFIEPDGNCMFRAFSYLLYQNQDSHWEIREKIVAYLKKNWYEFAESMVGDEDINIRAQQYIQRLEGGAWGDHIEETIFGRLYNRNIVVVSNLESAHAQVRQPDLSSNEFDALFLRGQHYELLVKDPNWKPASAYPNPSRSQTI